MDARLVFHYQVGREFKRIECSLDILHGFLRALDCPLDELEFLAACYNRVKETYTQHVQRDHT